MRAKLKDISEKLLSIYQYSTKGVWNDTSTSIWVNIVKTANLSIRSFLDKDLQTQAASLTYYTALALVPALAMILAIARGFGFQNIIQSELIKHLPAQEIAITNAFQFVESYLSQSSQGIFIGVGIIFLLWTLVTLLKTVEDTFNLIWGVTKGRRITRKITDYTAMFLLLPILIICSSGISIFAATLANTANNSSLQFIISPLFQTLIDITPFILSWILYTIVFIIIPHTKVKFKNALISGIICGTLFHLLQYLFVAGQIYVSKYNAIYGSFAFVPLLFIWLQLTWLITLSGVVITYSSQNIFRFNFSNNISQISSQYLYQTTIVILAIIVKRFSTNLPALSKTEITHKYDIPIRLVGQIIDRLAEAKIIIPLLPDSNGNVTYQPASDISQMSVGVVLRKLNTNGRSNFLPHFDKQFAQAIKATNKITENSYLQAEKLLIKDIEIPTEINNNNK
ncbi:MAG: YihY/virulence factor BrkB family protein [Bacteroidales bacterium]